MERFWEVFNGIRRVTIFVLGVFVTLDAVLADDRSDVLAKLIVGAIMSGVLPVENLLTWKREHKIADLQSVVIPPAT
jgi:hypothetical protein